MKSRITTANLSLTGLNTGDSFTLQNSGITSFQPVGTVTGVVKLQCSNDNVTFFDLETGLDVSQPFIIETTDYFFYRFVVTTIGTGTVKWSVSNSDTVSGGSGGASSLTLYGLSTNDYTNLEKSKLAGIESGAEVNNISDTDATDLTDGNDTTLHKHDNLYYTETEVDGFLSNKADLVGGLVPSSQLPSYVDDVLEFANLSSFPVTGETGKIYIDLATNLSYRWSGSIYVKLTDGGVNSFNTRTGAVTSQSGDYDASQITETGARVFVTPSEKTEITHSNRTALDNVSGVNTGDQDLSGLMVKSNNLSDLTDFDLARVNLGVASYTNGTAVLDFGVETDFTTLTVLNTLITNANLKGFSVLNTETLETSLDDFAINGVTFEIQNIVDNTSFDIVAKASSLASGNYTAKWLLTI